MPTLCWERWPNAHPRIAAEYRARPYGGAFVRLRAIGSVWLLDRLPFAWPAYAWPILLGVFGSYEDAVRTVAPDADHHFVGPAARPRGYDDA